MTAQSRPTTDAERRALQRRNHRALAAILDLGDRHRLPVLDWAVSDYGLVGKPLLPGGEGRRAAFQRWVDALDLEAHAEVTSIGYTTLRATSADWRGRRVHVAVIADIYDDAPGTA